MDNRVQQAAAAGVNLLSRESTLVPANLKQQIVVLEGILQALVTGRLVLANPAKKPVESEGQTSTPAEVLES